MFVRNDDGAVLDAQFSVVHHRGHLDLILESAGGASADRPARNADYRIVLEVLLARLRDLEATVEDAVVDTRYTEQVGIPLADRRLIDGPLRLTDVDLNVLRHQLTSRQALIGQASGSRYGNSTKRIRLQLTVPGYSSDDAERLEERLAAAIPVLPPESQSELGFVDGEHRVAAARSAFGPHGQASVGDVLEALRKLRLRHGPDDLPKRHQPLTLLWAVGRVRQGRPGLVSWPEARTNIARLIRDHGRATDRPNSELPFLALAGSDLWELTTVPPHSLNGTARRRWLNNANPIVRGGLTGPVSRLLTASEDATVQAAGVLLADYFDTEEWDGVLRAVGLDSLGSALRSSPARPRARRPAASGRIADAVLRAAIEQHAVDWAMTYHSDLGYEVRDVGSVESYDLAAIRGEEELHIEVKGSISAVDAVQLTVNEVEHALRERTDLIVVDQIEWERLADDTIRTSGGRFRSWPGWQPAEQNLRADRFRYRLPGVDTFESSLPSSQTVK